MRSRFTISYAQLSLTFSFCVDRKRPIFLSKQNTEVSFEYKQTTIDIKTPTFED